MKTIQLSLVLLISGLILGTFGCASTPKEFYGVDASELGYIGATIQNEPEYMEQVLADAGLTEAQFEDAIRQISANPRKSKIYRRSFEAYLNP